LKGRKIPIAILVVWLLAGCALAPTAPATTIPAEITTPSTALSAEEIATLETLEKLDDYPLYTMRYNAPYPGQAGAAPHPALATTAGQAACISVWGCALFTVLGDEQMRLYGRNFDWRFSPALLLFTDPPDGYASVSMVDIEYLGFEGEGAKQLQDLPPEDLRALLEAPLWPFDGMNERGLAVGMAAVPPGGMRPDPDKENTDQLGIMREVLDHAGTVDEALDIFGRYNIDMGSVPVHYLLASAEGDAAIVEFYQGEMVVMRNRETWLHATNFLLAAAGGYPEGNCWRYDRISQRLEEAQGRLSTQDSLALLEDVSQDQNQASTQWSIVYGLSDGSVDVVMGGQYRQVHTLSLKQSGILQ
jgi:hypothetical protein